MVRLHDEQERIKDGTWVPDPTPKPKQFERLEMIRLAVGQKGQPYCEDCNREHVPVFTISQIIDSTNLIAEWNDKSYWIEGVNTENQVDGKRITLKGNFLVGRAEYTTVLGASKTVFRLKWTE
jgi:hypothetical protein